MADVISLNHYAAKKDSESFRRTVSLEALLSRARKMLIHWHDENKGLPPELLINELKGLIMVIEMECGK